MNGPEHYREAERLLGGIDDAQTHAQRIGANGETLAAAMASLVSIAQVHATLALAAATIDGAAHPGQSQVDYLGAWMRVTQ